MKYFKENIITKDIATVLNLLHENNLLLQMDMYEIDEPLFIEVDYAHGLVRSQLDGIILDVEIYRAENNKRHVYNGKGDILGLCCLMELCDEELGCGIEYCRDEGCFSVG